MAPTDKFDPTLKPTNEAPMLPDEKAKSPSSNTAPASPPNPFLSESSAERFRPTSTPSSNKAGEKKSDTINQNSESPPPTENINAGTLQQQQQQPGPVDAPTVVSPASAFSESTVIAVRDNDDNSVIADGSGEGDEIRSSVIHDAVSSIVGALRFGGAVRHRQQSPSPAPVAADYDDDNSNKTSNNLGTTAAVVVKDLVDKIRNGNNET